MMKKFLSIILAIAMILALAPVAFAEGEANEETKTVLKYDFTSYGLTGSTTSAPVTTAKYDVTSQYTEPWAFVVHTASTNGNNCDQFRLRFNWYNNAHPQLGERAIALKLQVPAGNYSTRIAFYGDKNVPNFNVYMVPTSETTLCQKLSQTYGLPDGISEIPEKYYMGFVNGYRSSGGEKTETLKGINVAEDGEYYLVVAANGVDESFTSSNGLYEMGIRSLTLDKSDVDAVSASASKEVINIGDEAYATAEIMRGSNVYPAEGSITWSSENAYATVDAKTGKITGVSEGVAKIKATVGSVESEAFSVAIVNPDKDEYVYNIYGNALNDRAELDATTLANLSFSDINVSNSMPWRYVLSKKYNAYAFYYTYVASSFLDSNITANGFTAYNLFVPKAGRYDLSVVKYLSPEGGKAKIYFAPAAAISATTVVPSESGPVKSEHYTKEISFNGTSGKDDTESVGEVSVQSPGEYLVVIVPSAIDLAGVTSYGRFNYKGFTLTAVEDEDITDAFETETPVATQYSPSVSGAGYTMGETFETVEGITETAQADGSYKMYAPETSGDYKFLYWAKGLSLNKRILSYQNEFYYTPAGGDNNILIAVYDREDGSVNKAEFYNANGQLIKAVTETSENKTVPALPSMAGYNKATAWRQYNGEIVYTAENVGSIVDLSGTMLFVAEYEREEPVDVTVTVVGGNGTATVSYGDRVTCTADSSNGEFKWWEKTVGDTTEIVSIDATYSFFAWENCTITAEYAEVKPTYKGSTMKIVLDTFAAGDATAVMAEFIGFGSNTVEKGIMYNGTKIAMTRPGNQFTVTGDAGDNFKGYAIVKDGEDYKLIVDGEVTIPAAE